jgi:hypothetical protein
MTVFAVIGATSLYLLYGWLLSVIVASDLSDRKGYGERPGLASGLLTTLVGVVVWLFWPAKAGSQWSRWVRLPDLITAVAALVLFISLMLPWYSGNANFFEELAFYDLLLPLAAVVCYAQLHLRAGGRGTDSLRGIVLGAGVVALLMTIVGILTKPDGASIEWGAYISIAAAVVVALGAVLAAVADRSQAGTATTVAEARRTGAETA